ncbi:inner membrane protein [Piscinibacter sakaiensis]|uniref:Inner membrane protein n=1 Tax=Piscinibacter sakaiensis TaxID=1547922 RepID=A0A0K8NY54_PISS1|nr:inner membrane protein [Piscinibacter sakaiensis]
MPGRLDRRAGPRPAAGGLAPETLLLAVVAAIVLLLNQPFWQAALAGRAWGDAATWRFVASSAAVLLGLHAIPLLLLATRWSLKPLLALLLLASLVSQHMIQRYGVVLDPSMLRNTLRTDTREAADLMTPALLGQLALAAAAVFGLWRLRLRRDGWRRALLRRLGVLGALLALTLGALLAGFQDLSSTLRNDKTLRYRITPGNVVYSTGRVLADDWRTAHRRAEPPPAIQLVGAPAARPRLLVMVVGETARAMNFSLNGYARETNPRLARLPVINFPQTTSCGTSTEVSLPCMFSPEGRADYDEDRIRSGETLPQLFQRAGWRVVWLDNQSGCKGVCRGVDTRDLTRGTDPALCPGGVCFDGVLVQGLRQVLDEGERGAAPRDTLVLLHQMGNHGPAYFKRYPPEGAVFGPACRSTELRDCTREQIVAAYDNAIRYTDQVLAEVVGTLQQRQDRYDVAMMYASDHGESLGERGLYLHGMPEAIAPREQHAVPMLWWFGGDGARGWGGLDAACLRRRAAQPAHHDDLYHSMLGLAGLRTARYVGARDLVSPCRPAPAGAGGLPVDAAALGPQR